MWWTPAPWRIWRSRRKALRAEVGAHNKTKNELAQKTARIARLEEELRHVRAQVAPPASPKRERPPDRRRSGAYDPNSRTRRNLSPRAMFSGVGRWLKTFAHYTTRPEGDSEMRERGEDAQGQLRSTPLCEKGEGEGNSRWISESG